MYELWKGRTRSAVLVDTENVWARTTSGSFAEEHTQVMVPPRGTGLEFVPLGKVVCKSLSLSAFLHGDSNPQRGSELKWSWWNARGRDSTQVVTTSTAWSGLTSFLAVQGNGEEQPLWVSSCFVVGTEQSISESLHQQTSAHQTHLQGDYFLLICSKAADKRQGMGEGKMKGRSVEEEARLATSVTCFCCCLASLHHFFCSLI